MENNQLSVSQFIFYTAPSGDVKLEVFIKDETIWLTQKKIAELFSVDIRTINEHLINIYNNEELIRESTIRKFRIIQKEGTRDDALSAEAGAESATFRPLSNSYWLAVYKKCRTSFD